jgi:addiction module RelE/StbE family toxin
MRIDYHKKFLKSYDKLPPKIKSKFAIRLRFFSQEPFLPMLNNHSVESVYPGWRSINITGDYRALYEQKSKDLVVFMEIGTHSELYG